MFTRVIRYNFFWHYYYYLISFIEVVTRKGRCKAKKFENR